VTALARAARMRFNCPCLLAGLAVRSLQPVLFVLFAAGLIANALSLSGLLSELGGPIFQVGLWARCQRRASALQSFSAVAIHVND